MYLHPLNDCYIFFSLCLVILVQICTVYIYIYGETCDIHRKTCLCTGKNLFFLEVPIFLITEVSYLLHISNSKKTREKIRYAKCEWIFFGPPKSHKTTNSHGRKKWNPGPVKLANPIDFHLWFRPLSPWTSPGDFFFLGSADFLLVPGFLWKTGGFMKNAREINTYCGFMLGRVDSWFLAPHEYTKEKPVVLIRRRSPTKTCKTYTMLDLWEDEDAWKKRGVSKKHVPYWAVMLGFHVTGDNYFTPNFCTSSFSEWHHSSTNYLVISSHPPIWKKIMIFARFTPEGFGDK